MVEMIARPSNGGGSAYAGGIVEHDPSSGRFSPVRTSELTEKQRAFVSFYVSNGGNGIKAAELAGYSNPQPDAWRLRRNPAISAAITVAQTQAIQDGATVAWGVMQELMTDPVAPAPVRFQAAKWTLEASGHGLAAQALLAKAGGASEKSISEMSVAELEEHVRRQQAAVDAIKACEGRVIEAAPDQSSDSAGPV